MLEPQNIASQATANPIDAANFRQLPNGCTLHRVQQNGTEAESRYEIRDGEYICLSFATNATTTFDQVFECFLTKPRDLTFKNSLIAQQEFDVVLLD